jgi:hypothetical protein
VFVCEGEIALLVVEGLTVLQDHMQYFVGISDDMCKFLSYSLGDKNA